MLFLFVFLSSILCGATTVLLFRLYRMSAQVRELGEDAGPDHFIPLLREFVFRSVDRSLVLQSGSGGLADVQVLLREGHDPVFSALELLKLIDKASKATTSLDLSRLIKHLYQLQHAFNCLPSDLEGCLQPLLTRMKCSLHHGRALSDVQILREGDLIDLAYMFPLSTGLRVKQPLGVAIRDQDNQVILKAKVYAE